MSNHTLSDIDSLIGGCYMGKRILSDVDVLSVGLVRKGANKKQYFLLKEDIMPKDKDDNIEEVNIEEVVPGLMDKIKAVVGKVVKSTVDEALADNEDADDNDAGNEGADDNDAGNEDAGDADKDTGATVIEELKKAHGGQLEAIGKQHEAQVATLQSKVDEIEKSLGDRIEKAEKEAEKKADELEKRAYLEKAAEFRALPAKVEELGEKLHAINKSVGKDEMDWLVSLLKAVDNQLGAAGIFSEIGTSKTPEEAKLYEKVEKAQSDGNPAEALLAMPAAEQAQILDDMKKGAKRQ